MPTEADWKARLVEKAEKFTSQRPINEAYLRQAAVDAEFVTNHPAWDKYLRYCQIELDEANAHLRDLQVRIAQPLLDQEMRMVQLGLVMYTDRIQTLNRIMSIPKEILSHAHESLDNPSK